MLIDSLDPAQLFLARVIERLKQELLKARISSGLGNLSTKNRLRDRFSSSNLNRLLDRDFQGRVPDKKAEQVFRTGDRILDRS